MRSLGLDIGERRIGVATSDPLGLSAHPTEILCDVDPEGLRHYVQARAGQGVGRVVVGLPLTSRGREGQQAELTRRYIEALRGIPGVEIVAWDERLSTVEARKRLREAGRPPRRRKVDAEAAAIILQSYLEYEKAKQGRAGE
jgi:putative Holliday junction resolvase